MLSRVSYYMCEGRIKYVHVKNKYNTTNTSVRLARVRIFPSILARV